MTEKHGYKLTKQEWADEFEKFLGELLKLYNAMDPATSLTSLNLGHLINELLISIPKWQLGIEGEIAPEKIVKHIYCLMTAKYDQSIDDELRRALNAMQEEGEVPAKVLLLSMTKRGLLKLEIESGERWSFVRP